MNTGMDQGDERAYVFGTIFTLSNRLQLLGDRLDQLLTVKQWLFLAGVLKCDRTAPTLTEVAERIGTSRQNVKKLASILERQGFLTMEKNPRDARELRIELTGACLAHLQRREDMERRFMEDLFHGFHGEEMAALSGMLKRLEGNADGMVGQLEEEEE